MVNGMPCSRIPIVRTVVGALGEILKGRPSMLDVLFTLMGASLIFDGHYTWTVEK